MPAMPATARVCRNSQSVPTPPHATRSCAEHDRPAPRKKRPPHVGSRPSVRLPLNAGSSQIAASDGSVLTSAVALWLLAAHERNGDVGLLSPDRVARVLCHDRGHAPARRSHDPCGPIPAGRPPAWWLLLCCLQASVAWLARARRASIDCSRSPCARPAQSRHPEPSRQDSPPSDPL
jgi:hypothetical protein